MMLRIYCKSHRRQPVFFGWKSPWGDPQAAIPLGWCTRCGSEVFSRGQDLCLRCQEKKGVGR